VPHVLVIEDDLDTRLGMVAALNSADHATISAGTAMAGLHTAIERRPDLVLLDLSLPDLNGLDLLPLLRSAVLDIPVIVVTGDDEESQVIKVLDAGADDYLVKPFGFGTLLARVRAVLRRGGRTEPRRRAIVVLGGLTIDLLARTADLDGRRLPLSPKEFDLLAYLATRAGEVVSKRELLAEVWRTPYSQADKTVDVHVSWLRRKLGEDARSPRYLHTVRGVGLRLDAPGT
jgi:DNA-binding response OmpR family regulator